MAEGVDERSLEERVVSCIPAGTFEMATFCRLVGVVASEEVHTAAVTTDDPPRMLVNPRFVAEHCRRDEHLYLLVLHELWHVLLAHTRLYPRPTAAHNIALDAVINAGLARLHPEPEYLEFFRRLNPADSFPGLLLRPPEGWPTRPRYPEVGPPGTGIMLWRLYPKPRDHVGEPTYAELVALIRSWAEQEQWPGGPVGDEPGAERPGPAGVGGGGDVVLLGDHDDPAGDERAAADPLLGEVLGRITSGWPALPTLPPGRGEGGPAGAAVVAPTRPGAAVRAAFARLLRALVGAPSRRGLAQPRRSPVVADAGRGVLPNPRDRLAPARRRLGLAPTLWSQPLPVPSRVWVPARPVRVYLDVSGSMAGVLEHLCGLLVPHARRGAIEVFQFSTEVWPLTPADLAAGKLRTTTGTDGACVWRHLLDAGGVRRALVLTDGLVGRPAASVVAALQRRRVAVHVVLPAESAHRDDLAAVAASVTVLPPLTATEQGVA